jgi:hypothetical protein
LTIETCQVLIIEILHSPSGQVEGEYAFFHNCSAGFDVTEGSTVFNERRECVGMNLQFLPGSTLALQLRAIREEIVEMFPETKDMVCFLCRLNTI